MLNELEEAIHVLRSKACARESAAQIMAKDEDKARMRRAAARLRMAAEVLERVDEPDGYVNELGEPVLQPMRKDDIELLHRLGGLALLYKVPRGPFS